MSEEHQTEPAAEERRPPPGTNGTAAPELDVGGAETTTPAPTWPEDWRLKLSGGDAKRAKELERFVSPETFAKSGFEARERLRSTRAAPAEPPEEATELEVAEWRKQAGLPETPDGYDVSFGENATESQKADLADYLKYAHEKHLTPRAVKQSVEWFQSRQAALAEQLAQQAEETTLEHLAELRKTFPGREYKRNVGLANDYLNSFFEGPDAQATLDEILAARLPNGVQLTNHAPFIKAIVDMARRVASEDDLIGGDGGGGGLTIDEEFKELAAKPRLTTAERSRMTQLAEARIRRDEKTSAR